MTEDDARRVPWRNGRGTTLELCVWPEHASFERGDFDLRLSKAAVDEPGPFSAFAGFDRILVVTSGAGLVLTHVDVDSRRVHVRPLEPHRFSGDASTTAELVGGKVADFNVLTRRGVFVADVEVVRLGERRARATLANAHTLVHALTGEAIARIGGEEEPFELETGDTLWTVDTGLDEEMEIAGRSRDSVILVVRVEHARSDVVPARRPGAT